MKRGGYPGSAVRLEDRLACLRALRSAQAGGGDGDFRRAPNERLAAGLTEYVAALAKATP